MSRTRRTVGAGAAIGRRLSRIAKTAGIAHRDLANLSGVSNGAPGSLFRGEVLHPQITTVAPIARTLGVSLDWLVFNEGDPPTKEQVTAAIERARSLALGKEAA